MNFTTPLPFLLKMTGFGMVFEASTTHCHTLVGFAFDSGMFSFGFLLRTSILYNFIEADCGFSFFWTPPGQRWVLRHF